MRRKPPQRLPARIRFAQAEFPLDLDMLEIIRQRKTGDLVALRVIGPVGDQRQPHRPLPQCVERFPRAGQQRLHLVAQRGRMIGQLPGDLARRYPRLMQRGIDNLTAGLFQLVAARAVTVRITPIPAAIIAHPAEQRLGRHAQRPGIPITGHLPALIGAAGVVENGIIEIKEDDRRQIDHEDSLCVGEACTSVV
jgi:hypothetical protein